MDELNKELDPNCKHVFELAGYWNGVPGVGGPMGRCVKCKGKKNFTYDGWKRAPKTKKKKAKDEVKAMKPGRRIYCPFCERTVTLNKKSCCPKCGAYIHID